MELFKFSASRHQQDRGILLETEAKAKAPRFEAEAVKITPRGCLEVRQCLEAPHHGSSINCIGADANIGASALGIADVPAMRCCHQTQWRPAGSHMAVNYL